MYTSIFLVALTGSLVASSQAESVTWHKDYTHARTAGATSKKPLAVFIGSGAGGHEKVCRDGKLSPECQKMLADSYICCYVDSSTPEGKKLAEQFANNTGTGLVLSDRSGELQAFRHDGDLSGADLTRWLTYGADSTVVVRSTMNNASSRLSMYPPESGVMDASGYMIYGSTTGYSSGGVIFGGGCPGGNCYRR